MKIIDYIKRLFSGLFQHKKKNVLDIRKAESIDTTKLKSCTIYIESRGDKDRWFNMLCPCGCGDVISVNLMKSILPNWSVTYNKDRTVTLFPSIDKTTGCRSHFFVRNSIVIWA